MSQSEQVIGFVVKEEGVGDAGDRGGGGATLSFAYLRMHSLGLASLDLSKFLVSFAYQLQ
jgi:hypothetical protein